MKKEYNLMKNIFLSNTDRLKYPYKLSFAVTYRCNSRCKNCSIWKKKPKNEISLTDIEKFFQENNKFSWIDITGGEVFLREDIVDIIKSILKNCKNLYMIHIPTNGLLSNLIEMKIKEIVDLNPKKFIVTVSIDGPSKVNNEIRGINGAFESAVKTYKKIKKIKGVEVFVGMTLSEENIGKFKETYNDLKNKINDIKFNDIHVNLVHTSSHYYNNKNIVIPFKGLIEDIKTIEKLKGKSINPVLFLESEYLRLAKKYLTKRITPIPCLALTSSCFIDPYGDIYPCTMFDKKIGNIKDINLEDLWKREDVVKLKKNILNRKCTQCWTPCEAYQSILGNMFNFHK